MTYMPAGMTIVGRSRRGYTDVGGIWDDIFGGLKRGGQAAYGVMAEQERAKGREEARAEMDAQRILPRVQDDGLRKALPFLAIGGAALLLIMMRK